jgi:hypothetical protein
VFTTLRLQNSGKLTQQASTAVDVCKTVTSRLFITDNAWQPLAFFSQKLNPTQQKYSAYDRELLAVYEAVTHFRHKPISYRGALLSTFSQVIV